MSYIALYQHQTKQKKLCTVCCSCSFRVSFVSESAKIGDLIQWRNRTFSLWQQFALGVEASEKADVRCFAFCTPSRRDKRLSKLPRCSIYRTPICLPGPLQKVEDSNPGCLVWKFSRKHGQDIGSFYLFRVQVTTRS